MTKYPWNDWLPGVLSQGQLRTLCTDRFVHDADPTAIDDPTIDLRLTAEGYRLREGAMKPSRESGGSYRDLLTKFGERLIPTTADIYKLDVKTTYAFLLQERVAPLRNTDIYGQATAKSSIGRTDVLARLLVDGMDQYEGFDPAQIRTGEMFIEITPLTFGVRVKPGTTLTQLRLFKGPPEESEVSTPAHRKCVLRGDSAGDGTLSVDLTDTPVENLSAAAFCAHDDPGTVIDLWKNSPDRPEPWRSWRLLRAAENPLRLVIRKNSFYILRSKELISIPKGLAVYCRAIDETIGEMRIHYAGFAHPYFGLKRSDGREGTPLIFEVRGHDVDVNLLHGERMARLILYRMSEDAEEPKAPTPYNDQVLKLSNLFRAWPKRLRPLDDDRVEPDPETKT